MWDAKSPGGTALAVAYGLFPARERPSRSSNTQGESMKLEAPCSPLNDGRWAFGQRVSNRIILNPLATPPSGIGHP
jgi:hypothetical protein